MTGTALARAKDSAPAVEVNDPFGAQGSEGAGGGVSYVKFTGATGVFEAGQNADIIEHGTQFIANMEEARYTWSFWWDGEVMESFDDRLVDEPLSYDNPPMELPEDPDGKIDMSIEEIMEQQEKDPANFREGWAVQAAVDLRAVDGTDEQYCLKLNNGVALNAFHSFRKEFAKQRRRNPGKLPLVEISADAYTPKAKSAGKRRFAPRIKIVDWLTDDEIAAMIGENPADYDNGTTQDEPTETNAPAQDETESKPARGRRGRRGGQNLG